MIFTQALIPVHRIPPYSARRARPVRHTGACWGGVQKTRSMSKFDLKPLITVLMDVRGVYYSQRDRR